MTNNNILKQSYDQILSEIDGTSVLMSISTGSYFNLNKTATIIWNKLSKEPSLDGLITEIANEFKINRSQCEEDIKELLNELLENGLIIIE